MKLDLIPNSGLLSPSDLQNLNALSEELKDAYAKRQVFRTDTEARVSVLNDLKHPTPAAKYWQSVREQMVMLDALAMLSFDYRRNETAIKRHTRKLETLTDDLDIEETKIDLDECDYKRTNMEVQAKDRIRELKMWSAIKAEVDDGSFDTSNVNTHQLVSYTRRFANAVATANPAGMSPAEATNMYGLLQTAIRKCSDEGVLDQITPFLPSEIRKQLKGNGSAVRLK